MPPLALGAAVGVYVALFAWLAVSRHLAGGSHAEDLGFTDQVISNFLRGQAFRMSIYQGATWNTELDLARLSRPDSLLAFHVEPMLLVFVPLYALGGGPGLLLVIQSAAVALGAVPAYRVGQHWGGSRWAGLAVGLAYLLSPLGQWAVLSDFHTSTLAAPLLLLAVERLAVGRATLSALAVAVLGLSAREDVGPAVAGLGAWVALSSVGDGCQAAWSGWRGAWGGPSSAAMIDGDTAEGRTAGNGVILSRSREPHHEAIFDRHQRRAGLALVGLGCAWTIGCALVIHVYSGGLSPFAVRYGAALADIPGSLLATLSRPSDLSYGATVLLSGAWLGVLAPLGLLGALPSLVANALSSSAWMASGKAHYSGLVLPFVTLAAAAGLHRLHGRRVLVASAALVLLAAVGYVQGGAGPLAANYAPASVTDHARRADALAAALTAGLPEGAAVSASSTLVPHLSHRAHLTVFPAVRDADYVLVDLRASPAPTSAGDVFLRMRTLLDQGGWRVQTAEDGLLQLHREPAAPPTSLDELRPALLGYLHPDSTAPTEPISRYLDGRLSLLEAELQPSPDAAVEPDGPRWVLHTVWRAEQPLPTGTQLEARLDLRDGEQLRVWDVAPLWWEPPERWQPGVPTVVDFPGIPIRQLVSWQVVALVR